MLGARLVPVWRRMVEGGLSRFSQEYAVPTTWNAIFLGSVNFEIDPTEGNSRSEDADLLVNQSFGSSSDPLLNHIVQVTTHDNRGFSGVLDTNQGNGPVTDQITYDLGSGPQTQTYDGLGVYRATIHFADGSSAPNTTVVIFQDTAGNLFLAPSYTSQDLADTYAQKPIQSLTVDQLVTNRGNLAINRTDQNFIPCFVAGTLVDTHDGPRPVEEIRAGDLVLTVDDGPQPVRWVGQARADVANPAQRPVRICRGALGAGVPDRDLLVSPQHRVLIRSRIARRMFDADEVLVAAKHLLSLPGIEVADDITDPVYVHLLFDRHQLIRSNGAVTESLFTGPQALKSLSDMARDEIMALFPQLAEIGAEIELPAPVRPLIAGRSARQMARRHLANEQALTSTT